MDLDEIVAELAQLPKDWETHLERVPQALLAELLVKVGRGLDHEFSAKVEEILREHADRRASLKKRLKRVRAAIRAHQRALST
jgi:hypothetical protein